MKLAQHLAVNSISSESQWKEVIEIIRSEMHLIEREPIERICIKLKQLSEEHGKISPVFIVKHYITMAKLGWQEEGVGIRLGDLHG